MAHLFTMPRRILSGKGALELSGEHLQKFGGKAFIVTDRAMEQLGNVKRLTDVLDSRGIGYEVYPEISGEPTDNMVRRGARLYRDTDCDFLIGLGGGSPMDSMKAIGVMVSGEPDICGCMGRTIEAPLPPACAIPTTAGTGSEATQFTIITDTANDVKMLLKGPSLLPQLAIIDPVFTKTAPPAVTAATGVDALCHAIEAFTSVKAFPLADSFALSAAKRIFKHLKRAYDDGTDEEAREQMALAALEAGVSFSNSSVTIIHGMSRPIGALFHVPHGLSNAMLLPECLKFAVSGAEERFFRLGLEVGAADNGMTAAEGANAFVEAVCRLCGSLNIQTPEEFGIDRNEFFRCMDKMAEDALASGSPANTRRNPSKEEILAIYKALWH